MEQHGSQTRARRAVLVTGATGFIGRHTCEHLSENGWSVRALARSQPTRPVEGVSSWFVGNLLDRTAVTEAMRGTVALVHLAGRAHHIHDKADDYEREYRLVNVEGTRAVMEGAVAAGVRRIVFVSSIAAGNDCAVSGKVMSYEPQTAYGRSKRDAENVVKEIARRAEIGATIIRPTLVYGPGMKGNPLRLFQLVSTGLPLPFGSLRAKKSFLYVGNLTAVIGRLLGTDHSPRTLVAADLPPVSTAEFSRAIARALGTRCILVPFPIAALRVLGRLGDVLSFLPVNSDIVDRLAEELLVDSSEVRQILGGNFPFSMEEALARTAAWYRGLPLARS